MDRNCAMRQVRRWKHRCCGFQSVPNALTHGADDSRFLRALFQFSKRAAGEATEFSRSRVELLSVIGAAPLECGKPAAEAGEFIRRQLGNSFGDFFDFHVAQYSTPLNFVEVPMFEAIGVTRIVE